MSTKLKRFTISITPEIEKELQEAKKMKYFMENRTEKVRDLICLGLKELKQQCRTSK